MNFPPPFTTLDGLQEHLRSRGYALLSPQSVAKLAGVQLAALDALRPGWNALPPDTYLKDGGRYRRRRHASFVADHGALAPVPHRAHWQPVEYNALHGGMERWFEPMDAATLAAPAWHKLLAALAAISSKLKGERPWFVEAHQFRIDTTDGPAGQRFTLAEPWSLLLLDDARVVHETTPIQPLSPGGHRDTLVVTLRADGFQDA
jgi:hypothetical protein